MRQAWRELRTNPAQHTPSLLVVTIATLFGVVIVNGVALIDGVARGTGDVGSSDSAQVLLILSAIVFYGIALFVSNLVITNTFSIIIAGRARHVALLRLIGAPARRLRAAIAGEGLVIGVAGAVLGIALGVLLTVGALAALNANGIDHGNLAPIRPALVPVLIAPIVVTWLAARAGSRRVLTITPLQAVTQLDDAAVADAQAVRGRRVAAGVLGGVGGVLLLGGVILGLVNPAGVLIGLLGGIISFLGVIHGSPWVMPPLQRLVGAVCGRGAAGRLAARNAERYPVRTARTTMGLVIGVTLIITFTTALLTFRDQLAIFAREEYADDPMVRESVEQIVTMTMAFFAVMIGFSVIIATVGVLNNMSLAVSQRTREIGLLRALGLSRGRVRMMISAESLQLAVAALVLGTVLGIAYGWAGSLSMLGVLRGGLFWPTVPWAMLAGTVVVAAGSVTLGSLFPARRAGRIAPVAALRVE